MKRLRNGLLLLGMVVSVAGLGSAATAQTNAYSAPNVITPGAAVILTPGAPPTTAGPVVTTTAVTAAQIANVAGTQIVQTTLAPATTQVGQAKVLGETITAAPSTAGVAFTGANVAGFVRIAFVLLIAGASVLAVTRRRRPITAA